MDALKLIPQVFFDLIARVVPGAAAMVAILAHTATTWESWLGTIFGEALGTSPSVSALMLLACCYLIGQLLSPLAKVLQRIGELSIFTPREKAADYDWLRMHQPDAGAHCAKLRAEFSMHNGLAVVLIASACAYLFSYEGWRWSVFGGLTVCGLLMAARGRTTRDTFHEAVDKFAKAAGRT